MPQVPVLVNIFGYQTKNCRKFLQVMYLRYRSGPFCVDGVKHIWLANNSSQVSEVEIMSSTEPTKKQLGERAQAHIMARLLEMGYTVLTPYGDSSRYDLVIEDDEGKFLRVQCKTAWKEFGDASIQFATTSLRTRSTDGKVKYSRAGYVGQVECFAVYSHELRKTYL